MKNVSLTEARNDLLRLAGELEEHPRTVVEISKRGKPVLTLLSVEMYEALVETLDLLRDETMTEKLRRALREVDQGKAIPWEQAKKRLGIEG